MTQEEVFDIFTMGHNIFLTGAAGSGKTYLVNQCIRYCHEHLIGVAVTASTGIAATHIGGMTIHSWSGMGIRDTLTDDDIDDIVSREYLAKRFAKTSVLIIDEISMLSGTFLANLDRLLQSARVSPLSFGGMQVMLVGDFFQLPPVSRGMEAEFAFEHPSWRNFSLAICSLSTQYRQFHESQKEDPLLYILNEIRSGIVSETSLRLLDSRNISVTTDDHTELFTRNVSVDAYNNERLNQIHTDTFVYEMQSRGAEKLVEALKKGCLAPDTLVLKVGARVMFVKNNFEAGYVNGSIGHIVGREGDAPIVELLDGTKVTVETADWAIEENGKIKASISQVPLRLAWAITVHKSQGMTLDAAVMDLSDAFVAGQGYVALSRVRSLAGLTLRGYNATALQIDPRVRQYDRAIQSTSERVQARLTQLSDDEKKKKQESTILRFGGVVESQVHIPKSIGEKKTATHLETYALLQQGYGLEEIALARSLKPSTIMSHIEKLLEEGKTLDFERFRPEDAERLDRILDAFDVLQTRSLAPVREYLFDEYGQEYDYDEVRLARLFL